MYVRQIDEQILTLQVSGKLWMRSLVMRDMETGTEWAHLLGRGMQGPLAGRRLKPLVTDMVTWSVWKQQYPRSTVLHLPRSSRKYSRDIYRVPEEFVFGFIVQGRAWALPMNKMMSHPVQSFEVEGRPLLATFSADGTVIHLFDAAVDGRRLRFRRSGDHQMLDLQTGSRWSLLTAECVAGELRGTVLSQRVGIMSLRKAWANFHPESRDVPSAVLPVPPN